MRIMKHTLLNQVRNVLVQLHDKNNYKLINIRAV